MVIIRTSAVATIIHAVSAALISELAAKAGVTSEKTASRTGAASFAVRHECAPIGISPPGISYCSLALAPLPGAMEVF
jgi:hypothetical protein